jgi:hypothetical protein
LRFGFSFNSFKFFIHSFNKLKNQNYSSFLYGSVPLSTISSLHNHRVFSSLPPTSKLHPHEEFIKKLSCSGNSFEKKLFSAYKGILKKIERFEKDFVH